MISGLLTAESNPRPCSFRMVSWLLCLSGHYQFVSMCGSFVVVLPEMWGPPSLCSGVFFFCITYFLSNLVLAHGFTSHGGDLQIQTSRFQCSSTTSSPVASKLFLMPVSPPPGRSAQLMDLYSLTWPSCTPKRYSLPLSSCCLSSSHAIIRHNLVVHRLIPSRMAVIRKPETTGFGCDDG